METTFSITREHFHTIQVSFNFHWLESSLAIGCCFSCRFFLANDTHCDTSAHNFGDGVWSSIYNFFFFLVRIFCFFYYFITTILRLNRITYALYCPVRRRITDDWKTHTFHGLNVCEFLLCVVLFYCLATGAAAFVAAAIFILVLILISFLFFWSLVHFLFVLFAIVNCWITFEWQLFQQKFKLISLWNSNDNFNQSSIHKNWKFFSMSERRIEENEINRSDGIRLDSH